MGKWDEYHERAGNMPNPIVEAAVQNHVPQRDASLDLGAGNLRDSKFLLQSGFKRVVAVDEDPVSYQFLVPGIEFHLEAIEDYVPKPGTFDLVVCCNTLFFLSVKGMEQVLGNAFTALRSGGILVCNMLGEKDEWVLGENPNVDYVTSRDVERLQQDWIQVIPTIDYEEDNPTTQKHWHLWSFTLQKP